MPHKKIDMQQALDKENVVPFLVIGSGCAGYSAALYGARGKVKTVIRQEISRAGN